MADLTAFSEAAHLLDDCRHTAWRLESRRGYASDHLTPEDGAFLKGQSIEEDMSDPYYAARRQGAEEGKRFERVRVVDEPPTEGQLYQLEQARFNVGPARTTVVAHLLGPLPQTPSPDRMRAADWALRVTSRAPLRMLPPGARLAALASRAHHSPSPAPASARAEADRINRAYGTTPTASPFCSPSSSPHASLPPGLATRPPRNSTGPCPRTVLAHDRSFTSDTPMLVDGVFAPVTFLPLLVGTGWRLPVSHFRALCALFVEAVSRPRGGNSMDLAVFSTSLGLLGAGLSGAVHATVVLIRARHTQAMARIRHEALVQRVARLHPGSLLVEDIQERRQRVVIRQGGGPHGCDSSC